MALRYNCRIVVLESTIPEKHKDFVALRFRTNGMRISPNTGKPFWKPDFWGILFCYDKANTFMRMELAKDKTLYDRNYALKMIDPDFSLKMVFRDGIPKMYVSCKDIDFWREPKPDVEKIMKEKNKKIILEPLIEDISEMPDFDVGNNLDF